MYSDAAASGATTGTSAAGNRVTGRHMSSRMRATVSPSRRGLPENVPTVATTNRLMARRCRVVRTRPTLQPRKNRYRTTGAEPCMRGQGRSSSGNLKAVKATTVAATGVASG